MKIGDLAKRVENLTEKLKEDQPRTVTRLDWSSFSDAEKLLFYKVSEAEEEYRQTGNTDVLVKNVDLIYKSLEVILNHVSDLYCYVVPTILSICTWDEFEIIEYFFKLHFFNFVSDFAECIENIQKWSQNDRQEFLLDLKNNGNHFFRIPRGFNGDDTDHVKESTRKRANPSAKSAAGRI